MSAISTLSGTHLASYYSMSTQEIFYNGSDPSATVFYYDGSFVQRGIDLSGTPLTKITVSKSAIYVVWYSVQLSRSSGGQRNNIYIWPRINGIDLEKSNGRTNLNSNNSIRNYL
jgi:hypothetical protein